MIERPRLIWFDMSITTRHGEPADRFHDYFDISYCANPNYPEDEPQLESGAALCFEYDYPDRPGLSILCNTKVRFPHVPILMLTTQHSERLAVWAYRNRVLDYLVKPASREDLQRCSKLISAIQSKDDRQRNRRMIDYNASLPTEIPAGQRTGNVRLAPALHYVKRNFRTKIRNSDVAEKCGMSGFHFSHEFTETYGITFQEFVMRYRIFEACRELQHPNIQVANVAYSVGFNDPSYFARVFRRYLDMPPSAYVERVDFAHSTNHLDSVAELLELPQFDGARVDSEPDTSYRDIGRAVEYLQRPQRAT